MFKMMTSLAKTIVSATEIQSHPNSILSTNLCWTTIEMRISNKTLMPIRSS